MTLKKNRSGKSSIQRVVFGKMPPQDTILLESTIKIQKEDVTQVLSFFNKIKNPKKTFFFVVALLLTFKYGIFQVR